MISPSNSTVTCSTPPLCRAFPRTCAGLGESLSFHPLIHWLTSSMRVYSKLPVLDIALDTGDTLVSQADQISFPFQQVWEGKAGVRQVVHTWNKRITSSTERNALMWEDRVRQGCGEWSKRTLRKEQFDRDQNSRSLRNIYERSSCRWREERAEVLK